MITDKNIQIQSEDEKQQQYHLTTKKRVIFWLNLSSLLVFVILISTLLSLSWNSIVNFNASDQFYYANQVTYDWKQGFIIDIIIKQSGQCPSNYQSGFKYKWPGTNYGCRCTPSQNIQFVIDGICSPKLIQRNCRNIDKIEGFEASFWENQSHICIKRSKISFENQQKYNGQNKICGSSSSLVIVPPDQPCPIVNVTFNQMTLQQNQMVISDPNHLLQTLYASFNATSPYSFYTYPVSKFSVSEYQFCLIDQDTGLNPNHSDFLILAKQRGCAETGNYSIISSITEKSFYQNNPKLNKLSDIEGFPKPSQWQYNLGFQSLPSWKYQCRHNMNNKFSIKNTISYFNFEFASQFQTSGTILAILLSIICLQIIIIFLRRLFNSKVYPIGFKQVYLPYQFLKNILRYIVDVICKLSILGILTFLAYKSIYNWNWFKSAINQNCMDFNPQIQQYILNPYSNLYLRLVQYSLAQCSIAFILILIDIVHFRYIYRTQLRHYLVISDGRIIINSEQRPLNLFQQIEKSRDLKMQQQDVDPFRITMAMKVHEQDLIVKPKNKKKPRRMRNIIRQKNDQLEDLEQSKMDVLKLQQDENPFMLYQNRAQQIQPTDILYINQKRAQRKRR